MKTKPEKRTSIALTTQDEHLIAKIQTRLEKEGGKASVTAVLRRAIRALAERLSVPL